MSDPADAKTYARPRVEAAGLDWPTHELQIQTESGWRHWSSPGVILSSPTGSKGLSQLNSRYYTPAQWTDPYVNLDTGIAIMAGNLKKFDTYRKALAAFNWGPGHVGGGIFDDGRGFGVQTHSPWDGTRDWICQAGHGVSEQCKHYLDTILGPGWPEPSGVVQPPPPSVGDPWDRTQLITAGFSTPAEWPIAAPRPIQAIVWHDMEGHLAGAIERWNTGVAGAHLCVLEDGTIVRTVIIENIAWHAGTNNDPNGGVYGRTPFWRFHNVNPYSIGVELEGFVATGYTQRQVDACVKIGVWAHARYGIAPVHTLDQIPGYHLHGELSSSRTDPGPLFPLNTILQRIAQGGTGVPDAPVFSVGPGILSAMQAHGDQPASSELFFKSQDGRDEWSECFSTSGRRYIWLPAVGRVFAYEPAA